MFIMYATKVIKYHQFISPFHVFNFSIARAEFQNSHFFQVCCHWMLVPKNFDRTFCYHVRIKHLSTPTSFFPDPFLHLLYYSISFLPFSMRRRKMIYKGLACHLTPTQSIVNAQSDDLVKCTHSSWSCGMCADQWWICTACACAISSGHSLFALGFYGGPEKSMG